MSEHTIKRVTPPQAAEVLAADAAAILIDVRSKLEYDYIGHPTGAINVMWKDYPDWQQNPNFVAELRAALAANGGDRADRPILTLCRSGVRSMAAAEVLAAAGYTHLYNVDEGFEGDKNSAGHRGTVAGWKFHDLEWEQS